MEEEFADGDEVFNGSDYMIYIFGKGTFLLKGDGGFHNFCYWPRGSCSKVGHTILYSVHNSAV